MRHEIAIEGFGYCLRPIRNDDAEFIVELRSDSHLGRYLHTGAHDVETQLDWFAKYFDRDDDYYFAIERRVGHAMEGVVSIYDIDNAARGGEWGRWILRPSSLAAVESAYLIYCVAFHILKLESIFCRTVADNKKVVSFHDSCDIHERRILPQHFDLDGRKTDAVEHRLSRRNWIEIAPRLEKIARLAARRIERD